MTVGDAPSSLADLLAYQVRRASSSLQSALELELEPFRLRTSEVGLLVRIADDPGCTQGELGRHLRIKAANMVPLVSSLVSAGLVERRPGKGRAVMLHLTQAGVAMEAEVRAILTGQEARLTEGVSTQDRLIALRVIRLMATRACAGLAR